MSLELLNTTNKASILTLEGTSVRILSRGGMGGPAAAAAVPWVP